MGRDNVHGRDVQDRPVHGHELCNVQDICPWTYIYIYLKYYILYPIFEMQYLQEILTNPSINWYIDRVRQGLSEMSKTAQIQSLDPEILVI